MSLRNLVRGLRRSYARAVVAFLVLVTVPSLLPGCVAGSRPVEVSYGPLGPVELSSSEAASLAGRIDSLAPSAPTDHDSAAWPLSIVLPDGWRRQMTTVWPLVATVDGEARGDPAACGALAQIVRPTLLTEHSLADAILSCDSVGLVAGDVSGLDRELTADERESLAAALAGAPAEDPGNAMGTPPYPAYRMTLTWHEASAPAVWSGNGCLTLATKGVFGDLAWRDIDDRAWLVCSTLLPAPAPEEGVGLAKLFGATADVVASGGDLGQPIVCGSSHAAGLVRFLLQGEPSTDPIPAGDPVTVTFAGGSGEWRVSVYDEGFAFERCYYSFPGLKRILLTTMNAGY